MRFKKCAGAEQSLWVLALGALVGLVTACLDGALLVAGPQRIAAWAQPWALVAYSGMTWCIAGMIASVYVAIAALSSRLHHRSTVVQARLYVPVMLAVGAWVWWAAWELTSGRVASQMHGRALVVFGLGVMAGMLVAATFRSTATLLAAAPTSRRWPWSLAGWCTGVVCMWLDHRVLPRLYPPLHMTLFLCGVWAMSIGACAAFCRWKIRGRARSRAAMALVAVGIVVWLASALAIQLFASRWVGPIQGFSQAAPAGAKWARFWLHLSRASGWAIVPEGKRLDEQADITASLSRAVQHTRLHPRDVRHVLLITVDALRADRLRAYGGVGVTPFLDSLAQESVVWMRAYTPTPHTSYALASLHTGTFVSAAFKLGKQASELTTLAERLGAAGYRTAGFYPPAVFHVDRTRFAHWEQIGFGFQHRSVRDRSARQLVDEMLSFLATHPTQTPLLMWAHFLDPHEPYDPPDDGADVDEPHGAQNLRSVTGNGEMNRPQARYNGEVRAVDNALRVLVPEFRRRFVDATVIVTADHGEEFGDHGGSYHGTTLYDEQVRVPLIWSAPWAVAGRVYDAAIGTLEVATMLQMAAGLSADEGRQAINAERLVERMTTRTDQAQKAFQAQHGGDSRLVAFSEIEGQRMVTDGASKMICELGSSRRALRDSSVGPCMLFDLQSDPHEQLPISDERLEVWRRLLGELTDFPDVITRMCAMADRNSDPAYAILARGRLGGSVALQEYKPLLRHHDARVVEDALLLLVDSFGQAPRKDGAQTKAPLAAGTRAAWAQDIRGAAKVSAASETPRVVAAAALAASLVDRPTRDERGKLREVIRADYRQGDVLQQEVAWYLSRQRDPEVFPLLRAMAMDVHADLGVRQRATQSMARLRHDEVLPTLVGLLQDVSLRAHAAQALGDTGRRAAIGPLRQALATETYPAAKEQEERSLERLGAMPKKRATP